MMIDFQIEFDSVESSIGLQEGTDPTSSTGPAAWTRSTCARGPATTGARGPPSSATTTSPTRGPPAPPARRRS